MTQIPAGYSELLRAYHAHARISELDTSSSHRMLLFYSIECGLKYVYIKSKNLKSTSDLNNNNHDLTLWVKELRLPAIISGKNNNFRLKRDKSSWDIKYAHQVWRYGIHMNNQDEENLCNWLLSIKAWIQEKL